MLLHNLPQERLTIAVNAQSSARAAVRFTTDYVKERQVFGKPVAAFQNTKLVLADCRTQVEAGQALVDRALLAYRAPLH